MPQIGNFVIKSEVKKAIAKGKCHSSSDVFQALNGIVMWYLEQAVKRAKANGRKTVRGHDVVLM
jgi:histone H3/H4